jgi:hypothetical protein
MLKRYVVVILPVLLIAGGFFAIVRHTARNAPVLCEVCSRPVHEGMGYHLVVAGASKTACCARCGMHFQLNNPGDVRAAFARDFYSGSEIPAEKAFYVEGGNEEYCAHVQPVERKEIQSAAQLAYDRCTPPLVAFAKESDAEKYRAEHGGRLLAYAEALESVRRR